METRETMLRSLQARLDDIDQRMAQRADRTSSDVETGPRSQLESLRTRLAEIRARQHEKVDTDDAESDAGLVVLGAQIDNLYAEIAGKESS